MESAGGVAIGNKNTRHWEQEYRALGTGVPGTGDRSTGHRGTGVPDIGIKQNGSLAGKRVRAGNVRYTVSLLRPAKPRSRKYSSSCKRKSSHEQCRGM